MPVFDCATGIVRPETEEELRSLIPTLDQVKADAIDNLKYARDLNISNALSLADDARTPPSFAERLADFIAACHAACQLARLAVLMAADRDAVQAAVAGVQWPELEI